MRHATIKGQSWRPWRVRAITSIAEARAAVDHECNFAMAAVQTREALGRHVPALFESLDAQGYGVVDNFVPCNMVSAMRAEANMLHQDHLTRPSETIVTFEDGSAETIMKPGVFAIESPLESSTTPMLAGYVEAMSYYMPSQFNAYFTSRSLCTERYAPKLIVTLGEGSANPLHVDNFRDGDQRTLTTILYLQSDWRPEQGGYFRLFPPLHDLDSPLDEATLGPSLDIAPLGGRLLAFWSDTIPHAVSSVYAPSVNSYRWAFTIWFPRPALR